MAGQRIGYVRVSTFEQNTERQLEGITVDRTFTDKASGKNTERPQLTELMDFARAGDTIVVHSMDRLARNLDDLRRVVNTLTKKEIKVEFLKESLIFTGEDSPMAQLMLSVMGAFAEFERALLRERQREGIAVAKQKGVYTGRKKSLSPTHVSELKQRLHDGDKKAKIARDFGISRQTLYSYLRVQTHNPPSEIPVNTLKKITVLLWLQVENNSKFVRGKTKVRDSIENFILSEYEMKKLGKDSFEYELTIPYQTDEDLDETIYELLSEMSHSADLRNCFIEADIRTTDGEKSW